ncbi:MAG: hypothetical protein WAL22_17845 [Solirubrobacteraceae bacterium]
MIRQRINLHTPAFGYLVALLTLVLGALLVWYGLMAVLLAVKVSPHTVNSLSAYRTLYNDAADLKRSDFTTLRRLIAGFAGLIVFLVFLYLAFKAWPRPYLARGEVSLQNDEQGNTTIEPRAIERVAELAARSNPDVTRASGRLGDEELSVGVDTRRASVAAETLRDVHQRVRASLDEHDLPTVPVNVTLTGYDRQTRRELS